MGQGWPTGVWAQPPRGFPGQQQQSEYLAIEVTHLVQWNVLGSPIEVDHLLIWHRLQAPGWAHRHHRSKVVLIPGPIGQGTVRLGRTTWTWSGLLWGQGRLTCRLSPVAHNGKHQSSSEGSGGTRGVRQSVRKEVASGHEPASSSPNQMVSRGSCTCQEEATALRPRWKTDEESPP